MICTFFGHSDCFDLDAEKLQRAIEKLILDGVDTFYVGNQGHFDNIVRKCLLQLKKTYQQISFSVVLAYLPTQKQEGDLYDGFSIYPEEIEIGPRRFAIDRRNKWLISQSNYCVCCIDHTWGGAYKFARQAKRRGLTVINLGSAEL